MPLCCLPPPGTLNLPVAQKGRQHFLMPQVLAPRLELLRGFADFLPKPNQRVSETLRIEVRQTGAGECIPKDGANARCVAPVRALQPTASKWRLAPTSMRVAGNSGSSLPQSNASRKNATHSTTIWPISSTTGKK